MLWPWAEESVSCQIDEVNYNYLRPDLIDWWPGGDLETWWLELINTNIVTMVIWLVTWLDNSSIDFFICELSGYLHLVLLRLEIGKHHLKNISWYDIFLIINN
jgi:hypothetical protein